MNYHMVSSDFYRSMISKSRKSQFTRSPGDRDLSPSLGRRACSDLGKSIYARINDAIYYDQLIKASLANVSSVRTTTLMRDMQRVGQVADNAPHAAFGYAWRAQAQRAAARGHLH